MGDCQIPNLFLKHSTKWRETCLEKTNIRKILLCRYFDRIFCLFYDLLRQLDLQTATHVILSLIRLDGSHCHLCLFACQLLRLASMRCQYSRSGILLLYTVQSVLSDDTISQRWQTRYFQKNTWKFVSTVSLSLPYAGWKLSKRRLQRIETSKSIVCWRR
jgi:hypothetical protein